MTSEGISAFEIAVTQLLRDNQVRNRWKAEEFWAIVAQYVIAAWAIGEARDDFIKERIDYLKHGGPALSILLVANVTWDRMPLLLGNAVIGNADREFLEFVNASARGRLQVSDELGERWLATQVKP